MSLAQEAALKALARETREIIGSLGVFITEMFPTHEVVLARSGVFLPEALADKIPLDFSICQHVVGMNFPLVICDALTHPLMVGNKTVEEYGILAYLGVPIYNSGTAPMGALSAVENRWRRWSDEEIDLIKTAAAKATEILRAA